MSEDESRDEVVSLITSEIASLPEDQLAALFPFVVALQPFEGESRWLIARDGDRVLYWDAVEEQFATAELEGQVLRGIQLCGGTLAGCLPKFLDR